MTSGLSLVLWTTDISSLAGFLVHVCGLDLTAQHPGLAELQAGPTAITLIEDEADRGHPWWDALATEGATRGLGAVLRFNVPDVVHAHAQAEALGAPTVLPPHDLEHTRECQVLAPDGYLINLWQPRTANLPPLTATIRRDPTRTRPSLGGILRRR